MISLRLAWAIECVWGCVILSQKTNKGGSWRHRTVILALGIRRSKDSRPASAT